jgi:peptidoglycan biosynthesis protein MviN/MurJ (putative lipid II flippase)
VIEKQRGLVRAAGSISAVTALSRITGYFRDSLQAVILGAANSSDAFVIAYRIPNMLRRLVGASRGDTFVVRRKCRAPNRSGRRSKHEHGPL